MKTTASVRTFNAKVTTLKELIEHNIQEGEGNVCLAAERALGESSASLYAKMKNLFEATKAGYEGGVGPGGSAVTSAKAPTSAAHA